MAKTRLRAMKHIMYFAAFLVLTACGGGESRGTTTSVPAAPTPTVHLAAMGGVMNVLEVDVLTPNPTATGRFVWALIRATASRPDPSQ